MGHHRPAREVAHEQVGDVIQGGGARQVGGDNPVNKGGAHVNAGARIHQGGPAPLDPPAGVGQDYPDFQDGVGGRGQARGFQVNDRVAHAGHRALQRWVGHQCPAGRRGGVGRPKPGCGDGAQRAAVVRGAVIKRHRQ